MSAASSRIALSLAPPFGVEERGRRGAAAPEHDLVVGLDHLPDESRDDVECLQVEVVSRAVEVRRKEEDAVQAVLLAICLSADENRLLRNPVGRVRLLRVAVPEVVLL